MGMGNQFIFHQGMAALQYTKAVALPTPIPRYESYQKFVEQIRKCKIKSKSQLKEDLLKEWEKISPQTTEIFECLHFGLKNRGLLIPLFPDVSPASVAGIF